MLQMTCIWRWLVRMFVTVVGGTVFDVTKQMHVLLQINSSFYVYSQKNFNSERQL